MPARDGTGKILRAALPALTTTCYIHLAYGQSNSDGTNGVMR